MHEASRSYVVLAFFVLLTTACKGPPAAASWDGESVLLCGGHQVVHVSGKTIDLTTGPVFIAGGDCQLTVDDCIIRAPEVVSVGGSARVVFKGGRLDVTSTMAPLTAASAGNDPVAMAAVAQQAVMKPGMAFFAGGNGDLTVDGVDAHAVVGLFASGHAHVTLKGGQLTGTSTAIDVDGAAVVTVEATQVNGSARHGGAGKIVGLPGVK